MDRGRGRARGVPRGSDSGGAQQKPGGQGQPQQRPRGAGQQQTPRPGGGAWGPPQQQAPAAPAWGPPRQVQQQQQVRAPAPKVESMQAGRASYRGMGEPAAFPGPDAVTTGVVTEGGDHLATHGGARGAIRGRATMEGILHTRPTNLPSKQGTSGLKVALRANYFQLLQTTEWLLYQYRVDFAPEEDRTIVRKALFRRAIQQHLNGYLFDGTVLYTPSRLDVDPLELFVDNQEGERIRVTIKLVGDVSVGDYHRLQVFNIILRKCMNSLNLQLVGRNFFDAVAKVAIPDFRLELWPGYVTSIRQHESGILMCAEITHKVMRIDTVWHLLNDCMREDRANLRTSFQSKIIGSVVLTDYNNRTYHIDDVDWNTTPSSTFQKKDGSAISYIDYYKSKYQLKIRDEKQPMLISRAKAREIRAGMAELVYLVPELCRMTGLSEDQRQNFQLMRAVAGETRVGPGIRIQKLHTFCNRLLNQPEALAELQKWDFRLANTLVEFPGRQLPPEMIFGGGNAKYSAGEKADWTRDLRSKPMFTSVNVKVWVVMCPTRCKEAAHSFVQMLDKAAKGMSWQLPFPKLEAIPDDRPATYLARLDHVVNTINPSLIMCVVSNNKADRYAAIKKKCSVDGSVPTQVILAKNLTSKGAMTIATKVAIQMNCKLGGAPWTVAIPLTGVMIVGYDVCHDTSDKQKSFGAMVASLDKQLTRYFNVASAHTNGEELSNDFALNLIKACQVYKKLNSSFPEKIIIYRDGVGDGQLPYVFQHELELIKTKLGEQLYPNGTLKLAFIVVSKRINTRILRGNDNPLPGTVVDDVITLPERYDFFIVSQCVNQGTVSPTSYNILYDNTGMPADHIQRLSYKLTHLYYNWSGTVRVPAPCQYAHKLATLVGQYLHRAPHRELETVLHFL